MELVRIGFLSFLLMPGTAQAHVGHIGELAGHDHIVIGAAVGAIALAGLLGALKGRDDEDTEEVEEELQEA